MTLIPAEILSAANRLAGIVAETPLEHSRPLTAICGAEVFLKLECAQITGSFKLRGAANAIAQLSAEQRARGVVAASAGNHALGLAEAAARQGLAATLFVPGNASAAKLEVLRRYPAKLLVVGSVYEAAETAALAFAREHNATFVSAYSSPGVMAGQGTVALEALRVLPDLDALLVPVGGGGLAAGVATWAKAVSPRIKVIGVQSEASCVMYEALRSGRIRTDLPELPSLADGLAGSVASDTLTLPILQGLLDALILVREDEIARAMAFLLDAHHLIVEGSGAVGVAALLAGRLPQLAGRRVLALLTGRNVTTKVLLGCIQRTRGGLGPAAQPGSVAC